MAAPKSSDSKDLTELYDLVDDIEIAMFTTRRADGHLVSRPMETQEQEEAYDLWFVTDIETHKLDELEHDPHVNLAYFDSDSREWVSVSGIARVSRNREKIRELHDASWRVWFADEGGERDGGPDDPRIALIVVDVHTVVYMKSDASKPEVLFEIAKGAVTGERPEVGEVRGMTEEEIERSAKS